MKRLLALFMAAIGLSATALAVTIDLSNPNLESDYNIVANNYELVVPDGAVLTGTLPDDADYKVSIAAGATVTLRSVTIDQTAADNQCAGISCLGKATIILEGDNSVTGGYDCPGIFVPVSDPSTSVVVPGGGLSRFGDATLTIKANLTGDCCGLWSLGSLIAIGTYFGAGIGCGSGADAWNIDTSACGHIVIESGTIYAQGGSYDTDCGGAGIGSAGAGYHGDIVIKGGYISAVGGQNAPGIGGGSSPEVTGHDDSRIIILGGEVLAYGGSEGGLNNYGLGFGPGIGCFGSGALGDILIKGGSVLAAGGLAAPGIGVPNSTPAATCGNITIEPGVASVVVVAGENYTGDTIGSYHTAEECGVITVPGTADGYDDTTDHSSCVTRTIEPTPWDGNLTGLTRNVVAITGTTITGTLSSDRKVSIAADAWVTLDGVRINGSSSAANPHAGITCLGDATIFLVGDNYVRPYGTGPAAIAYFAKTLTMGNNPYLAASYSFAYVLDIDSDDGTLDVGGALPGPQLQGARLLDANISYGGAGLGAGVDEDCGDLVINGGTISATGGYGAAGIGGAHGASSGNITILGGNISATGGEGAAGVGSGDDSECGDITISCANVTATAGANATPIGAGAGGSSVNVTLDGVTDTTSGSTRNIAVWNGDLGTLTGDMTVSDGMTIYGTLAGNYKVSIAADATVTLSNAFINIGHEYGSAYSWAGLSCLGNATIMLEGASTVYGFARGYPGIHVPSGSKLTINGEGSLTAASHTGYAAGIGGGYRLDCGDIDIEGGTIISTGTYLAAGIGGGYEASCGDITIGAGVTRVTATCGSSSSNPIGAAYGSYSTIGKIDVAEGLNDDRGSPTRTIWRWDGNLATLTDDAVALNGTVIHGTMSGAYKVSIADGATVTLSNAVVNLDRDSVTNNVDYSWAGINCLGDANIILVGTSTVAGFYKNYPGIHVPEDSTLTINGSGTLNAIGTDCGGAGIGGGWEVNCGDIVINGGVITATGANSAPGIGVGSFATCGDITINGGRIVATAGIQASGIGVGLGGNCGDITIAGGTVDASGGGGFCSYGIGGGGSAPYQGGQVYNFNCGDISIGPGIVCVSATYGIYSNNGTVTVDSSLLDDHGYPTRVITAPGAWDGNLATLTHNAIATDGMTIYNTLGGIYKVSIADGATVTLSNAVINIDRDSVTNNLSCRWAGVNCAGDATILLKGTSTVSGFYLEYPGIHVPEDSTLTISGSGALNAIGTDCGGAGIGGGWGLNCGNIVIAGGNIVAAGANSAVGIGSGSFATCGAITISGGNVVATAGMFAAGIGSSPGGTCGNIAITGGTVDASSGDCAAGIGTGNSLVYQDGEFYCSTCGDISIGPGIVCVSATGYNPIGKYGSSICGTVTVASSLLDDHGYPTRVITAPGAWDGNLATLTHNAIATDGMTIYNTLGGIYKVSIADGATVTLSNAVINLDRDSVTNNSSCSWAGINCVGDATLQLKGTSTVSGFYLEYPGIHVPEDSTLTINGSGTLNAIGTDCGGAGIGGGCYVDCGNIVIAGGNIVATGANSVPGIGSGSLATCGDITISGGNVTATAGMFAAGIGSPVGGECGDIAITGGTVDSTGGYMAAGIGVGPSMARAGSEGLYYSVCGDISIGPGIVCVSATGYTPIGKFDNNSTCGTITIDSSLVDRTSADGMTRTITAASNTDFLPGDQTTNVYSTQDEAETAAASIQIVAPADVQAGLAPVDLAKYLGCFEKKVVPLFGREGYVVVVALTEQAEETLQEQADDNLADRVVPAITSSEVTVTTTPGFYYSVMWGDEPDCPDQTIPVLATGTSLALELPKGENPAATFYKLVIDFTR